MNIVTAAKMMALLEQVPNEGPEDDAYFIIHRLLTAELRKGNDAAALQNAKQDFLEAIREEVLVWIGDEKVRAIKMYRERTGSGLYEAKKRLEAGEKSLNASMQELKMDKVQVTSCG